MTTNHIDQLREWWENAEVTDEINVGDLVIEDRRKIEGGFDVWPVRATALPLATEGRRVRVLARAPKPKPAWHNAVAVVAGLGGERQVFVPTVSGMWESEDFMLTPDEMANPVPLIEAKVTDEMVDLAWSASKGWMFGGVSHPAARAMLAAALGLETE